ncbi:MAG: DUF1294 domain-containing protein [Clostridia bacterium]|nr:DUF1294 domain-containing protein [Clostridia bacterium]
MTLYIIIISLVAVLLTLYDKAASKNKSVRVPERILLAMGILGGALAMFLTMILIRHKTHHVIFMAGLPLILILHVIIGIIVFV